MKRTLVAACLALSLSHAAAAQGSCPFSQLRPIIEQRPALARYLLSTLDFAEWGMASRVGGTVNERLGGKRVGPYRIKARPKGAGGGYVFEVVVYTKKAFRDGGGAEVALERASSIAEEFDYLEVRPIEGKASAE